MTKKQTKKASQHNKYCYDCKECQKERNWCIAYLLLSNILIAISFGRYGWKAFTDIWYLWALIPIILLGWIPSWEKKKPEKKRK